jgi:GNAT superfamily N-acetyltransferase
MEDSIKMGLIRPATAADLSAIYQLWYEAEVGDDPDPPLPGDPALYQHELNNAETYVVERAGEVIAFATLLSRSGVVFLADFFVRAGAQSAGIGQRLLRQILPQDGRLCCTLSSADPRALALYIRLGLHPRWPHFCLRAATDQIGPLPDPAEISLEEGQPGDPALLQWDAAIAGRYRPADHAYWLEQTKARPLWFKRQGQVIGYGYAQGYSPESLWYPQAITLGPIGVRTGADATACVCAAVGWARSRAETLLIGLPGPHPALIALLDARFKITYVETFLASAEPTFFDPTRYLPGSSTLF